MLVDAQSREIVGNVQAMACPITVRAVRGAESIDELSAGVRQALAVFTDVQAACTRFDEDSPLMRANAQPDRWNALPAYCYDAVSEAYAAYLATGGRFDPRIHRDLTRLGYARSMADGAPSPRELPAALPAQRDALPVWHPDFRPDSREILLGEHSIDLGGIGKGLAVRWAANRLRALGIGALVEAGGDISCRGQAPEGGPWRVAVEDPAGGEPLAVLCLSDLGCATSSVRLRRWRVGSEQAHHLLDPRTGRPGGPGLLAVTVLHPDPATAEVWSKTLFLAGRNGIGAMAEEHQLPALWVAESGHLTCTPSMRPHLLWTAA
ncbi:MAG TPA: FAD:protein FMN transferase [Frankiaceae bacterium]|nr:FAD:protein FMN transferase [Frankiaceae bacterium]